jgi:hypothetical protein
LGLIARKEGAIGNGITEHAVKCRWRGFGEAGR